MAPKLPMGEADAWESPLTQQEANYIWTVIGWAAKKGIKIDPVSLLSLPSVSEGTAPVANDYQNRYAPTVSLYYDLYADKVSSGGSEQASPEESIAYYVYSGKTAPEIVKIIKQNPDMFPVVEGSKFERSTDYVDFVGDLTQEWQTYDRVYNEDKSKFVTDPYAQLNLPDASKTYKEGATYATIPSLVSDKALGRQYKSTPREDALLLATARAIDDKYIIPGLSSEMRPTVVGTTLPADMKTIPSRPATPEELTIGRQRAQVAREFAARGMSGNYGLGSGPIAGVLPAQSGPSRPVVTNVPPTVAAAPKQTADTAEKMRQRALISKLNPLAQRGF